MPSSSSRSRSPDSPLFSSQTDTFNGSSRPTTEPPSAPTDVSCQDKDHPFDSTSEEKKVHRDGEESSFLEEVLSSLKAPLYSLSPDVETESGVLEEKEEVEEEEPGNHETEGEEEEVNEPGDYQTKEEEEVKVEVEKDEVKMEEEEEVEKEDNVVEMEEELKMEEEEDEVKVGEKEDEVNVKEEVNEPDNHHTEDEDKEVEEALHDEDAAGEEEVKVGEDEDLTVKHPPPHSVGFFIIVLILELYTEIV